MVSGRLEPFTSDAPSVHRVYTTDLFNSATGRSLLPSTGVEVLSTSSPMSEVRLDISTNPQPISPIAAALKDLERIEGLHADWDSYGSAAPSRVAVATARRIIWSVYMSSLNPGQRPVAPYSVAPISGGGVQIEWRGETRAIEVEVSPEGAFGYLLVIGVEPSCEFEERDNVPQSRILELVRSLLG
jgi:hypothetical protein